METQNKMRSCGKISVIWCVQGIWLVREQSHIGRFLYKFPIFLQACVIMFWVTFLYKYHDKCTQLVFNELFGLFLWIKDKKQILIWYTWYTCYNVFICKIKKIHKKYVVFCTYLMVKSNRSFIILSISAFSYLLSQR